MNNQLIGTDKIGHFMSQGRKIYRRYLNYGSEERAVVQAAHAEFMIFGQMSNGNFSNADLVANYEGYRFYRSLFEDGIVPGKPSILAWRDGGWVIQRPFTWADHVNEYWDEALNVNHYDWLLYQRMRRRMVSICDQYWAAPELYVLHDEEALWERYAHLELRETRGMRLDGLCPLEARMAEERGDDVAVSSQ